MAPVYRFMADILANKIYGMPLNIVPAKGFTEAEWNVFMSFAMKHNIIGIVVNVLSEHKNELNIPRTLWMNVLGILAKRMIDVERKVKLIERMGAALNAKGLRLMVIKGYGLAKLYPSLELRNFGDIDIYLFDRFDEGERILSEELNVKISSAKHHHTTFVKDKILVENHYDFVNTRSHSSNRKLEKILKELANENVEFDDKLNIYLPSPTFNAIFIMRHMSLHFAGESVTFSFLSDWMVFLNRYHAELDWDYINKIYRDINMQRFAGAINGILIDYFNMPAEYDRINVRDKALEVKMLNEIISPAFDDGKPKGRRIVSKDVNGKTVTRYAEGNIFSIVVWKFKRFLSNKWKHDIIFKECWFKTLFVSSWAHLEKPDSIRH